MLYLESGKFQQFDETQHHINYKYLKTTKGGLNQFTAFLLDFEQKRF